MANRETALAAPTSEGVQVQPTAVEIAIGKALARVSQMKHVEVKSFITDYFFPLLGKLAKEQGDQDERLSDVEAKVAQLEGAAFIETFEDARDIIFRLAEVLDEVMVASGFYMVVPNQGLKATDKIPETLRMKYEQVGEDAKNITVDIAETIVELKSVDDGDGDGDPDEPDADGGDPDDGPGAEEAGAQAASVIADATKEANGTTATSKEGA